jgi:hypothetical protein
VGIGETLQTKAGPLPVWAWGVGGGVGLALLLRLRGAGGANPVGPLVLQPGSMGGGLSVNSPANPSPSQPAQGTGSWDISRDITPGETFHDPVSGANYPTYTILDRPRFYASGVSQWGRENNYGLGWPTQAEADAHSVSASVPAPSPAQTPYATTPTYDKGPTSAGLPGYNAALDRLRSYVGWGAQDRVNSWVDGAINNARQRGLWGGGNVTDANLRAIALGGVKWQQEDHHLTDPTASGFDLSSFVSNTLNPQQAVDFLVAGGVPNRYALDYSRTSESGRPLTATMPVGV